MPISRSTRRANRASALAGHMPCSRSVPVRSKNASSIESGSTSGVSSPHQRAHLAPDTHIFRHVGLDHPGVWAQLPRLEHRHRGFYPKGAGDIAGRRHHAAMAAADDHRLLRQRRIVALLDRRIEGVAIHMRNRHAGDLGMAHHPRRAACGAAGKLLRHIGKAVAAEARHRDLRRRNNPITCGADAKVLIKPRTGRTLRRRTRWRSCWRPPCHLSCARPA